MTKFILLKYVKKPIIFKDMKPNTNNFLHSKMKYVKIDLFGTGLNKTRKWPIGPKMAENGQNPLILNAPPHIKHGASY